jgi:RNA polymerase sigma-70 factor (ECF subfamily)
MRDELRAAHDKRVDRDLLKRLREADADAVERLVNTYGARAYRLAVRITGSEADAEEVVQDALWTVVRRVEMFRGDAALGTWIYRITANAAYDKLRRRGRRQREVSWDDLPPAFDDEERHLQPVDDSSEKGGDPAVQTELRAVLTAAIDELRAESRKVFVLHDMEGMSNPDIAATLGLTVSAVKSQVHRARLFLRRRLRDYLGEISTGGNQTAAHSIPAVKRTREERDNDRRYRTIRLLSRQPEPPQLRIEPHPSNPERGRRGRLVALGLREGIRDRVSFKLLKGRRRRILIRDA